MEENAKPGRGREKSSPFILWQRGDGKLKLVEGMGKTKHMGEERGGVIWEKKEHGNKGLVVGGGSGGAT